MLITIGALTILSIVILRVNNNFLSTNTTLLDSKFHVLATSLSTSIIEEATSKAFDASSDTTDITSLSSLTAPNSLGPSYVENYPNFNDFDDFNGLSIVDSSMPSAIFNINCVVEYVSDAQPDKKSNIRTWNKKITVFVSSKSMYDTISTSSIYSYWYFR